MFTPTETLFDSEGFSRLHTHTDMHTNTYTQTRSVLGSPLVNHYLHHHFSFLLLYEKIVFIYLFIFGCADDDMCVFVHIHTWIFVVWIISVLLHFAMPIHFFLQLK